MANNKVTHEIFLLLDSDNELEVGTSESEVRERFDENIGGHAAKRLVKLNVTLSLPELIEVDVTVPDDPDQTVTAQAVE